MDLDQPSPPLAATPAPKAAPPSFSTPVAAPRRRMPWLLIGTAFVAGLLAMAVAFHYYDRWAHPAQPNTVAATTQPGAATSTTVNPLAAAPTGATIDALTLRETQLADRLAAIEARTAAVDGVSRAAAGNAARAEALLLTLSTRRTLDRGQPLGYLEEQLRVRFGARQPAAVGAILQAARAPVTLEDLRASLDGVAPLLTSAAASEGWLASFRREMGGLIVIRHAGTPTTMPNDRLARARRALDAGQVEAALAEVTQMPGATSADAWVTAARRYVAARQALDLLESVALQGDGARG